MLSSKTITSLVFIDASIQDYQDLISGVIPTATAILLDSARDGVEQITKTLRESPAVEAIHIVSHGSPGTLYLGNTQLSLETLDRYISDLQTWFSSSASGFKPQLLLYGCNVAAGDAGEEFLAHLHHLTGASVAASTNLTGHQALGGDWVLEQAIGQVDAPLAFHPEVMEHYASVLSHFASGVLGWEPVSGNTVNFKGAITMRRSFYSPAPVVGDVLNITTLDFGDGANSPLYIRVTQVNTANDFLVGEVGTGSTPATFQSGIQHAYTTAGNFSAFFSVGARLSTLKNNADGTLRMETTVTIGSGNSAPVTTFPGGIQVIDNTNAGVSLFVSDPDGDTLRYRLATPAEMGGGTQPPGLSINSTTGVITFDVRDSSLATLPGDKWNTQVVVEDLDGSGNVKSKISFDLVVLVSGTNVAPTASAGGPYTVTEGQSITLQGTSSDPDGFVAVQEWDLDYDGTTFTVDSNAAFPVFTGPNVTGTTTRTIAYRVRDTLGAASPLSTATVTINDDPTLPSAPSTPDLIANSDTGISSIDNITADNTPTFSGTAALGGTVSVFRGSLLLGTTPVDGAGNWTFTPSSALSNGNFVITAKVTVAGKTSAPSVGLPITIDATPITSTASVPDLIATSDTGISSIDNITNETTPTLAGTAPANNYVEILANGVSLGTTLVNASGNWTFTPGTALLESVYAIQSRVVDASGNMGPTSNPVSVTIDTTAPAIPTNTDMTAASDDGTSSTDNVTTITTPTFTGKAEANSTVQLFDASNTLIGTVAASSNGDWSFTVTTPFSPGSYVIKARAVDAAGNISPIPLTHADDHVEFDIVVPAVAPTNLKLDDGSNTGSKADTITSDNTPTITGKATPGRNVELRDGTTVLGTTTADPVTGDWSYTPTSALAEGNRSLTAYEIDPTGSYSTPAALAITIDTTAPTAPTSTPDLDAASDTGVSSTDDITKVTTPIFTGSGTNGDVVTLYSDGVAVGTATVTNGSWSVTASTLTDGNHTITTTVKDSAGNESLPSPGLSLTIDTLPPAAPLLPDLDAASDSGVSSTDDITKNTTPTFTGSGTNGDVVTLYSDGVAVGNATVANGTWSVTASALSSGSHSITSTFKDLAGNESAPSAGLPIVINTTAPTAPTSAPDLDAASDSGVSSTDDITKVTTPTFTGSGSNGNVVTLYSDGVAVGSATVANGLWSIKTSTLSSGSHSITSTFKDLAGNESAPSAGLPIVINTTAPTAPTSAPDLDAASDSGVSSTDDITKNTTPTFTGSGTNGDVVTLYSDGVAVGTATVANGSWSVTVSALTDGNHTITTTVKDSAGNESMPSPGLALTIDTLPPAAPLPPDLDAASDTGVSITDNITSDTTPTFTGSGTNGDLVTLYSDGVAVGTATVANGSWSVTASALSSGNHTITSTFKDLAGNESAPSAGLPIVINTTIPTAPTIAPDLDAASDTGVSSIDNITNDTTPTFTGSGTAGDIVTLYSDGAAVGTATVAANGTWAVTTSPLIGGSHTITSTVKNSAGNESAPSPGLSITLSTGTPSGSTTTPDLIAASDTGASSTDNITRNTTPTFTGSGTAGDIVTLYSDGAAVGTATVAASGSWSVTASALIDGSHSITSTFQDLSGNESAPSAGLAITIDTSAPAASTVAPDLDAASDTGVSNTDNITKNSALTFKGAPGSGTAGTLVILYADGVAVGTGTVAADGSWSATTSPLSNGNRNITSTFKDLAGNESGQSSGLLVAIDSTPPAAPTGTGTGTTPTGTGTGTATGTGTGTGTGTTKVPNLTNDSTPTITGSAEIGSTIQVFAGTTALGTATVDNTGKWNFTPTTTLTDGTYPISFKVTDAAGNVSTANQAQPLVIDTKPATVKILDFGSDIRESSVNAIKFQFTEAVSNFDPSDVILTLDGKPVALQGATLSSNDAQTWTLANIPGLTKNGGDYKIDVKPGKVKDAAGNVLVAGASDTWLTGYTADAKPTLKFGKKRGTALDDNEGKDFLRGGKTQDRLRGFGGNDRLSGRGGNDRLLGGVGKDELRGGAGKDRLLGGSGNDRLLGGKNNDRLLGGKNNDRLRGDSGDDVLIGGQGKDILVGGTGKDTFVYNSLKERGDRIVSFESANDLIDLRGIFKGPQFKGENRFARYHQFVQLAQVGANTEVRIDADGSGSGTKFTTIATLQSTPLSNVRSTNFVIG